MGNTSLNEMDSGPVVCWRSAESCSGGFFTLVPEGFVRCDLSLGSGTARGLPLIPEAGVAAREGPRREAEAK